jgi:hypothetical protein
MYGYDAPSSFLETITDMYGAQYVYAYDAPGRVAKVTSRFDTAGAVVDTSGYDPDSRRTADDLYITIPLCNWPRSSSIADRASVPYVALFRSAQTMESMPRRDESPHA